MSESKDAFGDRMKTFENDGIPRITPEIAGDNDLILYLRLDGRSFSKFTKKIKVDKPRDKLLSKVFNDATTNTMKEFSLLFGFSQSDEISLIFKPISGKNPTRQLPFNGNIAKLLSVVTSYYTSAFIHAFNEAYKYVPIISFDCRYAVFENTTDATNMVLWRYQDAQRNYINDVAMTMRSAKQLHQVSTKDKLTMIIENNPEFNVGECASFYKRTTYMNGETMRSRFETINVDINDRNFQSLNRIIFDE